MTLFNRRRPSSELQLVTRPASKDALAIRITQNELGRIERLLNDAWHIEHLHRDQTPQESPVPAMMKALRKRSGAAVAVAERAGVEVDDAIPFYEHEVETVEKAYRTAAAYRGGGLFTEPEKALVDQLNARLGYAEAVRHLGPIPVFGSERAGR